MFDAAVIGLGAVGSAAAFELARRGAAVAGFDTHDPPHAFGSSHGETRLVRIAYAEGARYVPLARRSVALWLAHNAEAGEQLFHQDGVLYAGPAGGTMITGVRGAADAYGVSMETRCGLPTRPAPQGWAVLYEPEGGYALPEPAIAYWIRGARTGGAQLHTATPVIGLERSGGVWRIEAGAHSVRAQRVLLSAGGWTGALRPALAPLLAIERRVHTWFDPGASGVRQGAHPAFAFQEEGGGWFYGAPALPGGRGVKLSPHHDDAPAAGPETVDRTIRPGDGGRARAFAPRVFDGLGDVIDQEACFYTMSPDGHFIIEDALAAVGIMTVTGLSGHGFKFAPALGEHAALRLLDADPAVDLGGFSPSRFS